MDESPIAPRRRGPADLLKAGARRLLRAFGPEPEWVKRINAVDKDFDVRYGVDTGGIVGLHGLTTVGDSKTHGMRHVAVEPVIFDAALSQLHIDHPRFTFIDLGSGKGRALFLASRFPFRAIVGVEFARELHEAAQANLGNDPRVTLHWGDAANFEFPAGPVVLYLYNPFGAEIMRRVAARLTDSYKHEPREIFVLYLNPFQAQEWAGFVPVASGDLLEIYRAG